MKPATHESPTIKAAQEATIRLATAHVAAEPEFTETADPHRRSGTIAATRVGNVLVVSATGECADDLEKLLDGALLASPQVVA